MCDLKARTGADRPSQQLALGQRAGDELSKGSASGVAARPNGKSAVIERESGAQLLMSHEGCAHSLTKTTPAVKAVDRIGFAPLIAIIQEASCLPFLPSTVDVHMKLRLFSEVLHE